MKPLVSVVIPVYNTAEYLPLCMDTVLHQTWQKLEILLVDDGSEPSCAALCDTYAAQDPRVQVIHKPNGGAASARNPALDVMRGDYVTFVDSDDYIAPDMVEEFLRLAAENEADIVTTECVYTRRRELFPITQPEPELRIWTGREALRDITAWKTDMPHKLYRREVFDSVRFPEGMIYEDDAITAPLLWDVKKIVSSNQRFYYYFMSANSVMRAAYSVRRLDMLKVYQLRQAFYREKGARDLEEENELLWYLQIQRTRCDMLLTRWPERRKYLPMLAEMEKELAHVPKSRFYTPSRRVKHLVLRYLPHVAGWYYDRKARKMIED